MVAKDVVETSNFALCPCADAMQSFSIQMPREASAREKNRDGAAVSPALRDAIVVFKAVRMHR